MDHSSQNARVTSVEVLEDSLVSQLMQICSYH